jgi:hypothetical protein
MAAQPSRAQHRTMAPNYSDPGVLTGTPPLTREAVAVAVERLHVVAEETVAIAERLEGLAANTELPDQSDETLVLAEQIARTIAWLNEAQGALLFG